MLSNREIGRQFRLYAELLLLHGEYERLADHLAGAAYRLPRLEEEVSALSSKVLAGLFRPEIVVLINELTSTGSLVSLEELIQLTPAASNAISWSRESWIMTRRC